MHCPEIFKHIPHPHIHLRKAAKPVPAACLMPRETAVQRFNAWIAVKVTNSVGTMWCAYAFAALALCSFSEAWKGGTATLIAWIAQTFLQLVLLSIIIVGQKVSSVASDKRADDTYKDAEAVLHEAVEIQKHLEAQDKLLAHLIELMKGTPNVPCDCRIRAENQGLQPASLSGSQAATAL